MGNIVVGLIDRRFAEDYSSDTLPITPSRVSSLDSYWERLPIRCVPTLRNARPKIRLGTDRTKLKFHRDPIDSFCISVYTNP